MDELARAIEATLFASAEPLTIDELAEELGVDAVERLLHRTARKERDRRD